MTNPSVCPRCGSDDRNVFVVNMDDYIAEQNGGPYAHCSDPWHAPATSPESANCICIHGYASTCPLHGDPNNCKPTAPEPICAKVLNDHGFVPDVCQRPLGHDGECKWWPTSPKSANDDSLECQRTATSPEPFDWKAFAEKHKDEPVKPCEAGTTSAEPACIYCGKPVISEHPGRVCTECIVNWPKVGTISPGGEPARYRRFTEEGESPLTPYGEALKENADLRRQLQVEKNAVAHLGQATTALLKRAETAERQLKEALKRIEELGSAQ